MVKEEGKIVPTEDEDIKKLEGLGTKGMCIRLVLLPRDSQVVHGYCARQTGNPEGAL